jgi:hypothetical protein
MLGTGRALATRRSNTLHPRSQSGSVKVLNTDVCIDILRINAQVIKCRDQTLETVATTCTTVDDESTTLNPAPPAPDAISAG